MKLSIIYVKLLTGEVENGPNSEANVFPTIKLR
jgi:hypothetical protein